LAGIKVDIDFCIIYTLLSFTLTLILLLVSHRITYMAWDRKLDPDTVSLPYVTSIADLLGTGFIVVTLAGLEIVRGVEK
jgi:cation transporter-like permease